MYGILGPALLHPGRGKVYYMVSFYMYGFTIVFLYVFKGVYQVFLYMIHIVKWLS